MCSLTLSLQFFVTHRKITNTAPVSSVWLLGTQLCSRSSHEWGANTRYHKAWVKRLGGVWSHCCSRIGFPVGASQVHPSKWHPSSKRRFWCPGLWLPNIHTTPKRKIDCTYQTHILTHEYTHMCIYINTPHTLYPHTHAHTHTWIYTHAHIHIYITIPYIHTRIHTLTHVQANIWYPSYPILYLSHWLPQECSMRVTRLLCDHHYYVNCGMSLHSHVGTRWCKMWGQ